MKLTHDQIAALEDLNAAIRVFGREVSPGPIRVQVVGCEPSEPILADADGPTSLAAIGQAIRLARLRRQHDVGGEAIPTTRS